MSSKCTIDALLAKRAFEFSNFAYHIIMNKHLITETTDDMIVPTDFYWDLG